SPRDVHRGWGIGGHGLQVIVWFGYEEPRVKQREEPVASPFLCSSCPCAVSWREPGPGPSGVDCPDLTDQEMRPKLLMGGSARKMRRHYPARQAEIRNLDCSRSS